MPYGEATDLAAEQAVRESENKFSRIFQLSPDPVMITRLKGGKILDVNQSFIEASGYWREEVIGRYSIENINLWANPDGRQTFAKWNCSSG